MNFHQRRVQQKVLTHPQTFFQFTKKTSFICFVLRVPMSKFAMRVCCRKPLATNASPPVVRWPESTTGRHAEEDLREMWPNFYNHKEQGASPKNCQILLKTTKKLPRKKKSRCTNIVRFFLRPIMGCETFSHVFFPIFLTFWKYKH